MEQTTGSTVLTAPVLARLSHVVVEALAEAREELDALNVFPVADSDTGTNLFLTFDGAATEIEELIAQDPEAGPAEAGAAYRRGLLYSARGNSGVIVAQMVGTLVRRLTEPTDRAVPAALAQALSAATDAAYGAVGDPVEGTVLTVARAASEAALDAASRGDATVAHVLHAASAAGRDALARTPSLLPVLRRDGVVDAGGSGLCVVMDAVESVVTGKRRLPAKEAAPRVTADSTGSTADALVGPAAGGDLVDGGPAYEVMYLLDADDEAVATLRRELLPLGDSLALVGGDGTWNVHVHVDDVGAAIEAGIRAGRPHRVRVTHFAQTGRAGAAEPLRVPGGRRIVAVAFGEGLADVFRRAGASVVTAYPDRRPTATELTDAILATGAAEVLLLPNDWRVGTAERAVARAADTGVRVAVVPTRSQVQGLAALAVHEPSRSFDTDLVAMAAAGRHARSGAVTVAAVEAMTMAGPCRPGDVLGVIEGDFVIVGDDLYQVATGVLDRLLGGGGELVTIVTGAGGDELALRCAEYVAAAYPAVDVVDYDGQQQRYPVFFGVE